MLDLPVVKILLREIHLLHDLLLAMLSLHLWGLLQLDASSLLSGNSRVAALQTMWAFWHLMNHRHTVRLNRTPIWQKSIVVWVWPRSKLRRGHVLRGLNCSRHERLRLLSWGTSPHWLLLLLGSKLINLLVEFVRVEVCIVHFHVQFKGIVSKLRSSLMAFSHLRHVG